jgi:uncharacterized protein YbaP (TraB family)
MAQEEEIDEEDRGDDGSNAPALLWKIEAEGFQTSYLFGTIHVIGSNDFELPEAIHEKLSEVENLVLELDMDDPGLQLEYLKHAQLKDTTLEKLMNKDDYDKLKKALKEKTGYDLAMFDKMKPFALMSMFYPSLVDGTPKSYEAELINIAQEKVSEVKGLETVEFQMSIFDKIPLDRQVEMVMDLVENEEENKKKFDNMVALYKAQSVDGLYEYVINNLEEYKELEGDLLDDRNQKWIEQIASMMQEGSVFFAVGSGHLGGEQGVLKLLKQRGFKLTPVKMEME